MFIRGEMSLSLSDEADEGSAANRLGGDLTNFSSAALPVPVQAWAGRDIFLPRHK
jgi:hypothetical protein